MDQQQVASKLRDVWQRERVNKGITQAKAAEAIGIKQPPFSQYLNGVIPLNIPFILQLCDVLSVDPTEVYPQILDELPLQNLRMDYMFSNAEWEGQLDCLSRAHLLNASLVPPSIYMDRRAAWVDAEGHTNVLPRGCTLCCCTPANAQLYDEQVFSATEPVTSPLDLDMTIYCVQFVDQRGFKLINAKQYNATNDSDIEQAFVVLTVRFPTSSQAARRRDLDNLKKELLGNSNESVFL